MLLRLDNTYPENIANRWLAGYVIRGIYKKNETYFIHINRNIETNDVFEKHPMLLKKRVIEALLRDDNFSRFLRVGISVNEVRYLLMYYNVHSTDIMISLLERYLWDNTFRLTEICTSHGFLPKAELLALTQVKEIYKRHVIVAFLESLNVPHNIDISEEDRKVVNIILRSKKDTSETWRKDFKRYRKQFRM
mgnify:CR=1 FL=1